MLNVINLIFRRRKAKVSDFPFPLKKGSVGKPPSFATNVQTQLGSLKYGKSDLSHYHVAYFVNGAPRSDVYTCKNTENFNIQKFKKSVVNELDCNISDVVVMHWQFMSTQEHLEVYGNPEKV